MQIILTIKFEGNLSDELKYKLEDYYGIDNIKNAETLTLIAEVNCSNLTEQSIGIERMKEIAKLCNSNFYFDEGELASIKNNLRLILQTLEHLNDD